ncbi:MAG: hypothetical protein CR986_06635 [Ignavibacteriae bacterium]|nr:MAG: hypothetical protein CR986_06635 [Ignavibacteriota bacterium]
MTFVSGCTNPFAPKLDESLSSKKSLISDQTTIEGVFQNMQYAYTFKDTTLYGQLLDNDFTFTFRDYEKEIDIAWGRDEEMFATYGLFNNSERLDLVWNNIVTITNDSTNVVRSFNLTVTFNTTDVDYIDGKVNLQLRKNKLTKKWKIVSWIDESNF